MLSGKSPVDQVTVIDRSFYIPPGTSGFVYSDETPAQPTYEEDFEGFEPIESTADDFMDGDGYYEGQEEESSLDIPTFTIGNQSVRIGADGASVVDVTLNVDDVYGAQDYDVRVTAV